MAKKKSTGKSRKYVVVFARKYGVNRQGFTCNSTDGAAGAAKSFLRKYHAAHVRAFAKKHSFSVADAYKYLIALFLKKGILPDAGGKTKGTGGKPSLFKIGKDGAITSASTKNVPSLTAPKKKATKKKKSTKKKKVGRPKGKGKKKTTKKKSTKKVYKRKDGYYKKVYNAKLEKSTFRKCTAAGVLIRKKGGAKKGKKKKRTGNKSMSAYGKFSR